MKNIKELIEYIKKSSTNENAIIVLDQLNVELVNQLELESGINLTNYHFVIDAYAVKHILKNHSNSVKENSRGQNIVTEADLELLPEVLKNPDIVFYDGKNNIGKDTFQFQKQIGNKYIVIKEVRTKNKHLALNTMRIIIKKEKNQD